MYFLNLFPSTIINSGLTSNISRHLCIASIDALRIFISSIFSGYTCEILNATESFKIIFVKSDLSFMLNFFESLILAFLYPGLKITAAAVTGPAKHPRPASSKPHSNL